MTRATIFFITCLLKLYKYFISPLLGTRCRYLPTCSEYFIESLEENGVFKGLYLGTKRILSCHPVKFLGGGSGLDFVKKINKKGKSHG
tara:strand:+ start:131 stop:394 length:264 start_codon:yes stop_codon:yes gene_type:complete